MAQRLVVFVFFDKEGVLDSYIVDCVRALQRDIGPVLFIVNGNLNQMGHMAVAPYVQEIILRKNIGLDAWAFKEGLQLIGFDRLADYDEIVVMNDTCFGPLYSWSEVFDTMAARSALDFWGLTSTTVLLPHLIKEQRLCGRHVDSYFTVFRKRLLASPHFEEYWNNLPAISNYNEAIAHHERQICEFFALKGFQWGTYCLIQDGRDHVFFSPYDLIARQRCPLLKRRCFTHPDYLEYLRQGRRGSIYDTLTYIEDHLTYDTQLIWQHILRFAPEEMVLRNLGVKTPFSMPLIEKKDLRLSMLPRVHVRLAWPEGLALFKWKCSKMIKKTIKWFLYPFFKKYDDKQRKQ